jgi:hypothetical protein
MTAGADDWTAAEPVNRPGLSMFRLDMPLEDDSSSHRAESLPTSTAGKAGSIRLSKRYRIENVSARMGGAR